MTSMFQHVYLENLSLQHRAVHAFTLQGLCAMSQAEVSVQLWCLCAMLDKRS